MKTNQDSYYKRLAIIGGVILTLFLVIFIATSTQKQDGQTAEAPAYIQAAIDAEEAQTAVIKATLNLYYLHRYGSYPSNAEDVMEVEEIEKADRAQFKSSIGKLKDFEYKVKGDRSAYQFTYTSLSGETKTVEGNYEEEYH